MFSKAFIGTPRSFWFKGSVFGLELLNLMPHFVPNHTSYHCRATTVPNKSNLLYSGKKQQNVFYSAGQWLGNSTTYELGFRDNMHSIPKNTFASFVRRTFKLIIRFPNSNNDFLILKFQFMYDIPY